MTTTVGELRERVRLLLGDLPTAKAEAPHLSKLREVIDEITGGEPLPRETPVYLVSRDGETLRPVVDWEDRPIKVRHRGQPEIWGHLFLIQGSPEDQPTKLTLGQLRNALWTVKAEAIVQILCDGFGMAFWDDLGYLKPAVQIVHSSALDFTDISLVLCPEQKEKEFADVGTQRKNG